MLRGLCKVNHIMLCDWLFTVDPRLLVLLFQKFDDKPVCEFDMTTEVSEFVIALFFFCVSICSLN